MPRTKQRTRIQDFIVTPGDEVRGEDPTAGAGTDLPMRGGNASVASGLAGGATSLAGGAGDGVGAGGAATVQGGDGGVGGDLTLRSGISSTGAGSQALLFAGNITNAAINGAADSLFLHGSDHTSTGAPGGVLVRGGNADSTGSEAGGDVEIQGGLGDTTAGGNIFIRSGGQVAPNTTGITGDITISTSRNGTGGTDTDTGAILITTTGAGATAGITGDITVSTGDVADATGNNPGDIALIAGRLSQTGQSFTTGGGIVLTAGNSDGNNDSNAGSVSLIAGIQDGSGTTNAAGPSNGGDVILTAGSSSKESTGTTASQGGEVLITAGAGLGTNTIGGDVEIVAGASTGSEDAGSITLTPGVAGGGGSDGSLIFSYATWPLVDGAASTVLTTNGAGTLSWAAVSGALAGLPGNIYESLVAYIDPSDRNSYVGTGTTVVDIEGNATAGTLIAGAALTDGNFEFDGASADELRFTKGATLDNLFSGSGGTIISFVRPSTDGLGNLGRIVDTTDGDLDEGYYLCITGDSSGRTSFRYHRNWTTTAGTDWTTENVVSNVDHTPVAAGGVRSLSLGAWASVAVAYDDTVNTNEPTFWVNGDTLTTGAGNGISGTAPGGAAVAQSDAGNPLSIGNTSNSTHTFDGQIGPVLLFDRILDSGEVQAIHNALGARYGMGQRGIDSTLSATSIIIQAGAGVSSAAGFRFGGDVIIRGGENPTTSASRAGDVFIAAGDKTGAGAVPGGDMTIRSGEGGIGSNLTIGVGTVHSGSGQGNMIVHGGDNDSTGGGGPTLIRGGEALSTGGGSDPGGAMVVRTGTSRGAATNGVLALVSRGSSNSTGFETGDIYLSTRPGTIPGISTTLAPSTGTATTQSGDIYIDTEAGGTGALGAGDIRILTGTHTNNGSLGTSSDIIITAGSDLGTTAVHDQGAVSITSGNKAGGGRAGPITITAGDNTGTGGAADSGSITLTSGSVTSGGATADVGNIELTLGSQAGAGSTGRLIFDYATWPAADGSSGDVLSTNGAGILSWAAGSGLVSLQQAYVTGNTIVTNTTEGDFDVSGTEAISLDASAASNFTVASASLTLATTTSGAISISAADGTSPGTLTASAGDSTAAGTAGAAVSISAGTNAVAAASGAGGDVTINAGDVTSGTSTSNGGDIVLNPGTASGSGTDGEVTINGKLTVTGLIDPTGLVVSQQASDPGSTGAGEGTFWARSDAPTVPVFTDSNGVDWQLAGVGAIETSTPTWSFQTNSATGFAGGFYEFSGTDDDFSPSVPFGTANVAKAAHFMIVTGAVPVGSVTIRVTGTSITDAGVRTAADTEDIVVPNATVVNSYFETSKKWNGTVTVSVFAGTPITCNYGWSKYFDFNNANFTVIGLECLWESDSTDSASDIEFRHHTSTGWTFNVGADPTPPTPIAGRATDYGAENDQEVGQGAWKRANLSLVVNGAGSEGIMFEITSGSTGVGNLSFRNMTLQVSIQL
jgi:hypothetical protein